MNEVISTVVANGIWATLFVFLLVFELKDSRKRESRYTLTIQSLSDRLAAVNEIRLESSDIKSDTESIKSDTGRILVAVEKRRDVRAVKSGGAA